MKEVGEQPKKAKRNILRSIWCALMICMSVMLNVQAQDITERIEGQDSVYVNGSYQPRAEPRTNLPFISKRTEVPLIFALRGRLLIMEHSWRR